jgi:hypothetical protein
MARCNQSVQICHDRGFNHWVGHGMRVFGGYGLYFCCFFSPVLLSGRLLAPGEGLAFYLPAFYAAKSAWTDQIFAGYPLVGDPQMMTWYPLAMLFSRIPGAWNIFVLLAYILAASFAYGYVYTLTRSVLSAIVTGLVYSMSGFMIGHLAHVTMIHCAAWIPLLIWTLEQLRYRRQAHWIGIGIGVVASCILSGHPQIAAYGLGLGLAYAVICGWSAPIGRWCYYRQTLTVMVLGILLCALQIIPTIEFTNLSNRGSMTFEQFTGFSLPPVQLLQFLFPYLFGGPFAFTNVADGPYQSPYWGQWNLAEITGYLGWLPWLMGLVGAIGVHQHQHQHRVVVRFWIGAVVIGILCALGKDGGISYLLYHVPIYNKFRVQGRHLITVALAVSVLAGFGIKSIESQWISHRHFIKILLVSLFSAVGIVGLMCLFITDFQVSAAKVGIKSLSLVPWQNAAVGRPLLTFMMSLGGIALWSRYRCRKWFRVIVLVVLVLDLSNFSWFWEWQALSPAPTRLPINPTAQVYRQLLATNHQRLLTIDGVEAAFVKPFMQPDRALRPQLQRAAIFPNLTRLWQLPTVDGYSSFILTRFSQLMRMHSGGSLIKDFNRSAERELDLMAVRYLLLPQRDLNPQPGMVWDQGELGLLIGSDTCGQTQSESEIDLTTLSPTVTGIGLVTTMGCSVGIPNQADVLQLEFTNTEGQTERHALQAGRDTAEQTYECSDVQPHVQHQQAPNIFRSVPNVRPGLPTCQVHEYTAIVRLDQPQKIRKLRLKWLNQPGFITVNRMTLLNNSDNHQLTSQPLDKFSIAPHWQLLEQNAAGLIYENQRAMPRAWLVPEAIAMTPVQILEVIRTAQLPDGRIYEPTQMALVEHPQALLQSSKLRPTDRAAILKLEDTRVKIQTQAAAPTFLVLSDVFYPGWQATIDGQPTKIYQTNYVQRGVKVPAGEHVVEYRFEPMSFKLGAGITIAALFLSGYWVWRVHRQSPVAPTIV